MGKTNLIFSPQVGKEKYYKDFSLAITPVISMAELFRMHYNISSMEPPMIGVALYCTRIALLWASLLTSSESRFPHSENGEEDLCSFTNNLQ